MQVTQTLADGLKQQFQVVIPAGQLSAQIDSRLTEVGRTARIPGFRPGKVPLGILRKKYGRSVLNDILEGTVNDSTDQVLKQHDVRPALRPKVEITSFSEGADLIFTIGVESLPIVEVADLSDLVLERPVAEVTEEAVADTVQRIARSQEKTEAAPDRAAAEGDVVVIDFVGSIGGVPFADGSGQGISLKLGSKTFIPGFEDQLVGAKAGEAKTVAVTFPADYQKTDMAGKEATFAVTVTEVRVVVPTPIDDSLAVGMGFDTLDGLKERVRQEIADDYAGLSRTRLKRALMDALAERHAFAVPQGMVDVEFNSIWTQFEADRKQGQIDAADAAKSDDVLKSEYRAIAERRVRLGLVLSEIGQRNAVVVSQEDINRALYVEARRYPGQEQAVFQYYQKNQDAMMSLRAPLFEEKVVDLLISRARVTDRLVTPEELADDEGAPAPQSESPKSESPHAESPPSDDTVAVQAATTETSPANDVPAPPKAAKAKKTASSVTKGAGDAVTADKEPGAAKKPKKVKQAAAVSEETPE